METNEMNSSNPGNGTSRNSSSAETGSVAVLEDYQKTNAPTPPARKIKKIPPYLRRRRVRVLSGSWYERFVWRLKNDSQFLRSTVQISFILLCLWIGIEFHLFVRWGMSVGEEPFVERPPGVEGFLPISALISLKYWVQTGIISTVHPSGLFILVAIVIVALFLKKAFCGWLCPIGTISESLWLVGRKIFRTNVTLPRWTDLPLRSVKYLLLFFFLYSIAQMDVRTLQAFIYSPYNKVADIKMYLFFAELSEFAFWTLLILIILSVVIKNFWCRYLCPYGALLGSLSLLSPLKITRSKSTCIDCELCTKVCPADINVHIARRVWSDECMSCLKCVEICPVQETLEMKTSFAERAIPNWVFGVLVCGTFIAVTGLGMLSGHWRNAISKEEYSKRFQQLDSPVYQHNRGEVPKYGPED